METRQATVRGVPMRWQEHGDGFPVVFVHGIPTGPALWRHVVPRVEGARCLAWEMVGYGDSIPAGRDRDLSVRRQADYLLAWLDELGIDSAVLAGHDLGGGVAQIAAVRRRSGCAGLLLTNAIAYDSWPIASVRALRASAPLTRRLPDAAVKPMLAALMYRGHDTTQQAKEALDVHWRPYARHGAARALAHQVRSLDVRDTLAIEDEMPRLDLPARVVWGAADPFQKVHYGERLAWDLGTELRRIEGGKHFVPEDHPERIAAAANELVEAVS
ncbi:MAG TPA: alpha/beta fold hydrolase [Egibacteraceae bacterium]|nr:alpha/beta fold hydrolase [Actinomycetota bacterium]HWB71728.1 alpha/beta fold hydrolase [Egibacteraceae bacterium]